MSFWSRSLFFMSLLGASACAQRHVQLKFPDTSPGEEYACAVKEGQAAGCKPATVIDPAKTNQANTVFVILPRECKGKFNEVTIHDSGSSTPTVDVKCAPQENVIH